MKGSGFQNCENRSNILRVKNEKKKEKGFDNSSQHLKTMLRGVYIQNILLTNAVWQQETVSPLEDEVELLFFLGLGT